MNEKQQQLTFDKGITNVPSDALCSDNALEESIGMIYDNGEHRAIQAPVTELNTNSAFTANLLYVHNYNDNKRYIFVHSAHGSSSSKLSWGIKNGVSLTVCGDFSVVDVSDVSKLHITSIGKTLIVSDGDNMYYFLWKGDVYSQLTYPFPDLDFEARLVSNNTTFNFVYNTGNVYEMLDFDEDGNFYVVDGKQEDFNNLVVGLYNKNLKEIARAKRFAKPFYVRAALELYDGTYTYITNPILLFPSVTGNTIFSTSYSVRKDLVCGTNGLPLYIRQGQNYEDYSDIIKDVVVFASDGVNIYNTSSDQNIETILLSEGSVGQPCGNCVASSITAIQGPSTYTVINNRIVKGTKMKCLNKRDEKYIVDDLKGVSKFYKIASLGSKSILSYVDIATKCTENAIEFLTTQEQLPEDDYFSRCMLKPNWLYAYNSRLNIANASRGVFNGFGFFTPIDNSDNSATYHIFTNIETESGDVWVERTVMSKYSKQGFYFYYPDSRAKRVVIAKGSSTLVCDQQLTEHPFLHGAYYLKGLPDGTEFEGSGSITINSTNPPYTFSIVENNETVTYEYDNSFSEALPNYIIQSEVNNPFVFKAAGYFKVGTGKIMAMSTITQAISEGQFGQYPLLVFSESGIWSLSVASTGYYSAVHPMSREVCNNPKSVTQTDGAVYFSSEKGLMVVVGNSVKCVSEQLSGKKNSFLLNNLEQTTDLGNFRTFLKNCFIAYDYRDSLLWIFNSDKSYCWIYSIKSGTFSKYQSGQTTQAVNDYPDYLLSNYSLFRSLLHRPDPNVDYSSGTTLKTYTGTMITRPMKLENALALKSILQVRHILDFTESETPSSSASLTLQIYASNNLKNWTALNSLRGMPWKYYRFRYNFTNLRAVDRFAGSLLITQERRTNKLR